MEAFCIRRAVHAATPVCGPSGVKCSCDRGSFWPASTRRPPLRVECLRAGSVRGDIHRRYAHNRAIVGVDLDVAPIDRDGNRSGRGQFWNVIPNSTRNENHSESTRSRSLPAPHRKPALDHCRCAGRPAVVRNPSDNVRMLEKGGSRMTKTPTKRSNIKC